MSRSSTQNPSRREFLSQVGSGMIVASVGAALASDMGLSRAFAGDQLGRVQFGKLEPLVDLLQSTQLNKLLPLVVEKIKAGTSLKELTAAAALANARAFGGEDYIGFHTLMALGPALGMAGELPPEKAALPVLKVLYRNSEQIQKTGGPEKEIMKPVEPGDAKLAADGNTAEAIREAVHRGDRRQAELLLAGSVAKEPQLGFDDLLPTVDEGTEVHRVVLAHRAWDMVDIVGQENALSMLRQSLGFCLKNETIYAKNFAGTRKMLPRVMDQFKLESCSWGTKTANDKWVLDMVTTLFTSTPDQAAEAVAAALAEGICPPRIFEAITLTANQLVLRDPGRTGQAVQPGKGEGSVHGDSIGVHASDSANAWRSIAVHSNQRNRNAAIVLAGYQVAADGGRGGAIHTLPPRPLAEHLEQVKVTDEPGLLAELQAAVESSDQAKACAVTARIGEAGYSERKVLDVLLPYAVSQDGALHAEKYYRTTTEDFKLTRKSLRWRHLIGLARVTASEYGREAAGYKEACELLGTT
ncbi:MAG: hypothetical protein K8R36_13360 [Planctomycetales bacterium]|nr:hypothetical protein [Planctomycetales bacterium]